MLAVCVQALLLASRGPSGEPEGSLDAARAPANATDAEAFVAPPPYGNATAAGYTTLVHANASAGAGAGAFGRCGILWHYHVPKCAGTSFLGYLRNKRSKGEIKDLVDITSLTSNIVFDAKVGPRLDAFALSGQGLLAVHHHHRGPGLHSLKPRLDRYRSQLQARGCDLYLVTMLRDPFERTASALAYNLPESLVWGSDAARTAYWNRELDGNILYDNMQVRYVLNNHPDVPPAYPMSPGAVDRAAVDRAATILQSFAVVGFTEGYDDFVTAVARVAGLRPQPPLPRTNVTPKQRRLDAARMPPLTRDRVLQRTDMDRALVEAVR